MAAFEVRCTPEQNGLRPGERPEDRPTTIVMWLFHGDGYGWAESRRLMRFRVGYGGQTPENAERSAELHAQMHSAWLRRMSNAMLERTRATGYDVPSTS